MRLNIFCCLAIIILISSCCPQADVLSILNDTDREFAKLSSADNNGMMALSANVLSKSNTAFVKEVADIIHLDCSEAKETLHVIAMDLNMQLSDSMNNEYSDLLTRLQMLHGRSFDSVFIHGLSQIHKSRTELFSIEIAKGINTRLRKYAQLRSMNATVLAIRVDSVASTY